jgi:hypothetical protein
MWIALQVLLLRLLHFEFFEPFSRSVFYETLVNSLSDCCRRCFTSGPQALATCLPPISLLQLLGTFINVRESKRFLIIIALPCTLQAPQGHCRQHVVGNVTSIEAFLVYYR